jgi:hypothetical protein
MSDDPLAVACKHLANSQTIIEKKNAEIAQLKEAIQRLADQDATLSVCNGDVTVTMDATLTSEEREALEEAAWACGNCNGFGGDPTRPAIYKGREIATILRNLLERTKDNQNKDAIC